MCLECQRECSVKNKEGVGRIGINIEYCSKCQLNCNLESQGESNVKYRKDFGRIRNDTE